MKTFNSICAAVCTYNRYDWLDKVLGSLVNQEKRDSVEFEIVVVDNTPDNLKDMSVREKYKKIPGLLYVNESRAGLSNARNVAASRTKSEIIAYIDDDAIADSAWASQIIDAFNFKENIGVVGGRIDPIWEIEKPEWINDSLYGYLSVVNWGGSLRINEPNEWFAGANVAFRSDLVKKFLFNTNLGRNGNGSNLLSNEESQLIEEIRKDGYVTAYAPEASVRHLIVKDRLNQQWFRKRIAWQAISDFISKGGCNSERMEEHWKWFISYMWECPPEERSLLGLLAHKSDPDEFKKQLDSIYNFTINLLGGFKAS